MYQKRSNSGHTVEWNPEDEDAARKAMDEVDGTGVSADALPDEAAVDLAELHDDGGQEVARKVQERYQELTDDQ